MIANSAPSRKGSTRYSIQDLVKQLDWAISLPSDEQSLIATQMVLGTATTINHGFLPNLFLEPAAASYARRPIHVDPAGRYSLLAMVWAPGQGTALHDHGGLWVVECPYHGQVQVTNYEFLGESEGLSKFRVQGARLTGRGEFDFRVPPQEHHVVENTSGKVAVTLHVFSGVLERCSVFEPVDGGYRRTEKVMAYSG